MPSGIERHRAVERAVETSGLEWTFLRPDEFASNILWKWGESIRAEGVVRAPYRQACRALVHEADVADVAATTLLEPGHSGRTYVITGPELLNQIEQCGVLSEVLGRTIRFHEIGPAQAKTELTRVTSAAIADMVVRYLEESVREPLPVDPTVEQVTGHPARSLKQWVTDHADEFR